jgi:hypothetical protein
MRRLRRLVTLLVALGVVPFLPIYARCEMTRSTGPQFMGDRISYRWHFGALIDFIRNFSYMTPEEHPRLLLLGNLLLALLLATGSAFAIDRCCNPRTRA